MNNALLGIRQGLERMEKAAGNLARMGNKDSGTDPATDIVDITIAQIEVKANAAVIKAADEAEQSILDIFV